MSARYHALASDELMTMDDLRWPEGLRPLQQEPTDPYQYPGMHWWLFEDDGAPSELHGKRVELAVARIDGLPVITDRSVIGG